MNMNMDATMFRSTEDPHVQHQSLVEQNDAWMHNDIRSDYSIQQLDLWPTHFPVNQNPLQYQPFRTPQSSLRSNARNSGASSSSHQQSRLSMASTDSSWSNPSSQPYNQRVSGLSNASNFASPISMSYASSPADSHTSPAPLPTPKRKAAQRHVTPEKDPFATCVSRTRRSRRSQREPNFWCTSCEEPFIEKYDWKRHEETYQERRYMFRCSLCSATYFLDKDFLYHHETRHNCETCRHTKEHLESSKQDRQTRSGWGCGFCTHFSADWKERCNHIAQHFERDGVSMKDWRHSNVIHSLLQRPGIREDWIKILQWQPQLRANLGWNQRDTGRVEGYPENDAPPHLQDLLEYYRPEDNTAVLAQFAFEKIAFPSRPPQIPRKDYKDHHTATLQGLMNDPESWNKFIGTIPEDDILPTSVCDFNFDFNTIDDTFGLDTKNTY